jgi:hypothetical protein
MVNRRSPLKTLSLTAISLMAASLLWAQATNTQTSPPKPPAGGLKVETKVAPNPGTPAQAASTEEAPQKDPPKAVVGELEFDAGTVNKGDVIKHDFMVKNDGKGILEITRVQPACGCTVTQFDHQVEPGKTGKITANVNTANFSGPIHKTISVATNDPAMNSFQLAVKATVKAILNVEPSEYQQFGLVFKGQSLEKEFTLRSEDGAPFEVTQIQAEDPALKYQLAMAADKKSATFKVTLPEDHATGPVAGRFTLSTTHPKAPTVTLSVFGTVRDPLTVYPMEIVFTGLNKSWIESNPEDIALNKTITVAYEMGQDLKVDKVSSSLPFVEVSVQPLQENQRYSVKVHLKAGAPVGDFAGTITIETNKKTVTVPIRGKIF